ncbi:DUF4199 domain-containing protein, partial [Fulvivirga aurantia]|uniref:DUF4199 domain-containing protein n=1 Tax=Fulvivirga aurantia TaxID=2529383 RepID=UPI0031B5E692
MLGVISIVIFILGVLTELSTESWWSWVGLIPTIALIVMAHNQFKSEGDGFMSYGQGLKIGMLVVLISSIISTVFFYVYIKFIDDTFIAAIREKSVMD